MSGRRLTAEGHAFLLERHLATLTTLRVDGTPHVVPVGFTFDAATATARVITDGASAKARHLHSPGRVSLCQVDTRRWLTLEGVGRVATDPDTVSAAEAAYATRYRPPRVNPTRVVLLVAVDRLLGAGSLVTDS